MAYSGSDLMIRAWGGETYVIEFTNRNITDQMTLDRIRDDIVRLIDESSHPKLVIDFSGVTHLSSAMLGTLMSCFVKIKKKGGSLRICGVAKNLLEAFRLTRVDKLIEIHPNADAALNADRK